MAKKKKDKTMLEVSKGYEDFIKEKSANKGNLILFQKAIRKASTVKQRDLK